jgi:hypothetical protein
MEVIQRRKMQVFDRQGPPGAPGAQAVSFVAQMEVAIALAAQRRRAAGDAVFLDVAAMLDGFHSNLRRKSPWVASGRDRSTLCQGTTSVVPNEAP